MFDIKEQISIVFHLSLSVMNKKTLESQASYLELKRYQTYIHLLKQRRVRRGYLQLFPTQTVVTSTEPEAVSHKIVARHVVPHPDLKGIGPQTNTCPT